MDTKPILTVPKAVIKRLPMYHRFLTQLLQQGIERISSRELSQLMGITSSQLRQDLSYFGEFGQQGYGYRVEILDQAICSILGLEKNYQAVIVGAGNMGRAIAGYSGFSRRGLKIVGIFDSNPNLVGNEVGDLSVQDVKFLPGFLAANSIEIGIITTPASAAQGVADILMEHNIKGIWNFAPTALHGNKKVVIEDMHIGDSLLTLFYKIK
ncbi:MAG: redox-sensing transcriptional repressor Rex [Peptococcaceae bacterium]